MKKLKEMSVSELQARYAELVENAHAINDTVEAEKRDMNDGEKEQWNSIKREMESIRRELELRAMDDDESKRARAGLETVQYATRERQESGRMFREFLKSPQSSLGDGIVLELRESLSATGTTEVAGVIPVLIQDFVEPLNKGLIINQLGLKMLTGLKSDVAYPIMPSFEAEFVNEKEVVKDTIVNSTNLKPKPHRIAISVPITDLANIQTDGRVYNWILNNLAVAVARTLNRWMFQATPVITGAHGAMSYDASANAIQQVADVELNYKSIVGLRGKVQGKGAYQDGSYAYVMSGELAATLESTRRFESGDTPILVDGKIGGVPVLLTEYIEATGKDTFNASPKHIGFGRWSDAVVAQFGEMKLTIDPYTGAKAGITYLVLNTEYSVDLLRKESFVIGTLKTA